MKRANKIWFLLLVFISVKNHAQEGLKLMPLQQDSMQLEMERQMEYRQLISGNLSGDFLFEDIKLPEFDFNTELYKRYSIPGDMFSLNANSAAIWGLTGPFYSPFFHNPTILSEAAYKVGDKFTFGGYSYGFNPLTMPPAAGFNNFNRYGSTMFMQYKVNKNFKIETRFNVTQGNRAHPGF